MDTSFSFVTAVYTDLNVKKERKNREDSTLLKENEKYCQKQKAQRTLMPKGNKPVHFTNIHKQLKAPFVVYADSECLLKPLSNIGVTTGIVENPEKQVKYQEHVPYSFAYKIVSIDPDFRLTPIEEDDDGTFFTYKGEKAADKFIESLEETVDKIFKNYINKTKPIEPLTAEQLQHHYNTPNCHICENHLTAMTKENLITATTWEIIEVQPTTNAI